MSSMEEIKFERRRPSITRIRTKVKMWSQLVIAVSLAWVCVAQLSSAVSGGASLVATSSIASQAATETAASTYVQSNVPTGTPVPGR